MPLIFRTNCPTNEYWGVDYLLTEAPLEELLKLVELRDKAVAFLKECGESWGHVELPSPVDFSVHECLEDSTQEILDHMDTAGLEQWRETPDGFEVGERASTELHCVKIFGDGSIWLEATSKHSGDYVETEFPLEELLKHRAQPQPA